MTVHVCADAVWRDPDSVGRALVFTLEQIKALQLIEQAQPLEEECVHNPLLLLCGSRRHNLTPFQLRAATELSRRQAQVLVEIIQRVENTHMALMLMTREVENEQASLVLEHFLCWVVGARMVVEKEPARLGQEARTRLAQTGYVIMKSVQLGSIHDGVCVLAHEQMPFQSFMNLSIETRPLQCHKAGMRAQSRMSASP